MGKDSIQVTVRVRPLLEHEDGQALNVKPPSKKGEVVLVDPNSKKDKKFNYNDTYWSLDINNKKDIN